MLSAPWRRRVRRQLEPGWFALLDRSGGVLSRLLQQPFTSAFLGAVLEHDFDTHRHMLSVGALTARVAIDAGLAGADAIALGQAGLFHDVGKIHVPRALLNERAPLRASEWHLIRAHAERGEAMLREHGAHALADVVRGHHERLDGSGYPDGLRGLRIPDATRLLAVVDAYDAMRAGRPYAPAVDHDTALERLSAAHHLYDADAVLALIRTLRGTEAAPSLS
jgi:HD-GYP domain-containing protein (c-di-GMP phosphodiesterase class II)